MVITYKTIPKVVFPVFILPSGNWYERDGLLYLDRRIIDDRNMTGETIGKRRMQTPMKNLMPIRGSLENLTGIIKQTSKRIYLRWVSKNFGPS